MHIRFSKNILILFIFLMFGCAQRISRTDSYLSPDFDKVEINKIAIFPVRNLRSAPSEGRKINPEITEAISQRNPEIEVITERKVLQILNEENLVEKWSSLAENYSKTSIINTSALREIGSAVNADAILYAEITDMEYRDREGTLFTASVSDKRATAKVSILLSLLNTEEGFLLWENSSEGRITAASTYDPAPPLADVFDIAIDNILDELPEF